MNERMDFFGLKDPYMYMNEDRLLFFFMMTFSSFPRVTLPYTAPRGFLSCTGYIPRPSSFFFFFFSFFSFFSSPPPHQSSILTIIQRFPTILLTHHTNTLMHRPIMPLTGR